LFLLLNLAMQIKPTPNPNCLDEHKNDDGSTSSRT
jgi:hypothetical protein